MDATAPLVSVLMSVYNGDRWLKEAIESILRQTFTSWEFIIIDDASDEPTQQILRNYADHKQVKIFRNETRQGLTKNLNTGIMHCKGDYIARMDADDISQPERLQKQAFFLLQNPDISAVGAFIEFIDETGNNTGTWPDDRKANTKEKIKALLPWKNCLAHPAMMVRKRVLQQFPYNETQTHSQDWDLWLRLSANRKIIDKIPETLLLYRTHPASVTAVTVKQSAFRKKHEFYSRYLADSKMNGFNLKVWFGFLFNRIKLFLSGIKRSITS
jgi:glycosyltransferase involved in cell wall biosynthesis